MGRRFPIVLTFLVVAACSILIGLGNWQWHRLDEKEAFIAGLQGQSGVDPLALPADPPMLARITVSGTLLTDQAIPVRATLDAARPGKSLGGLGFWWLVPLKTDFGRIVLVNLGFVPAGADNRPIHIESGAPRRTIVGIVRPPDHGNLFLPNDDPAKREFFRRDPALLAGVVGVAIEPQGRLAPFTIDAERTGNALEPPVGMDVQEFIAQIPNNHLSYALTWWGLAATLLAVYGAYLISVWRQGASRS